MELRRNEMNNTTLNNNNNNNNNHNHTNNGKAITINLRREKKISANRDETNKFCTLFFALSPLPLLSLGSVAIDT